MELEYDGCIVVLTQVRAFYGDRFNLAPTAAYFRFGLPDVFILMLIGTLPDFIQGFTKLGWTLTGRRQPAEPALLLQEAA